MVAVSTQRKRCSWAVGELLTAYHDQEYGRMTTSDRDIFERICLESFSAGLSWLLVLRKRPALRAAFGNFDLHVCAALSDAQLEDALKNPDLIRNRRKIEAVRSNARVCLDISDACGTLRAFVERFSGPELLIGALRQAGIRQFGPSGAAELMKSMGLLEAHENGCFLHGGNARKDIDD